MDLSVILSAIGTTLATVLSLIWSVYATLLNSPLGFIVIIVTIVGLYWLHLKLPEPVQRQIGGRIGPGIFLMTRPVRWWTGAWLTSDQAPDSRTKIVEKVVRVSVPARRSFGEWLRSGFNWGLFYMLVLVVYTYWTSILPYIK